MKRIISICTITLLTQVYLLAARSFASSPPSSSHRFELHTQYGFAGLLNGAGYTYVRKKSEYTLALRLPAVYLSRGEFTGAGVFLSYRKVFPLNSSAWSMTADVSYGNLLNRTSSPVDTRKGLYQLHEAYLSYGWKWNQAHWIVGNSIGYGYYMETQTNFYTARPLRSTGHGAQIKLWLGYAF